MSLLLDSTIKVSLIVLMALGAGLLLRRQSAAVRHWVMAVAMVCAVVTPVVGVIAPSWHIGFNTFSPESPITPDPAVSTTTIVLAPSLPRGQAGLAEPAAGVSDLTGVAGWGFSARTISALVGGIWLAGVAISLSILVVGMARLASLASGASRIESGRLASLARETAADFELRRPVEILQSSHPALLATWGYLRPKVILPADAGRWSDDRARVVLRHELAHIRRGDWAVLVVAEVLRAVYWFNPLVWMACSRVRQESECACDDAVMNAGVEGSEYATHLLELARALTANRRTSFPGLPGPPSLPASAMARPSSLEGRIRVMLNPSANRSPVTRRVRIATIVVLLGLTVSIAGLGAQAFFTLSGSVFDATNRTLPDAKLVLTNAASQAKHEVRSNRTGRFEFVGVPPGDYALEVSIPGFSTFKDKFTVVGNMDRTIELQVGSLEETITVTGSRSTPDASPDPASVIARQLALLDLSTRAKARQQATLEKCTEKPAGPMGGQILAPMRLNSANPTYPDSLRAAGIGGVVKMEAVIGTDGNVQDVRILESPHPDLESAAMEAVLQWQYTPTLLNCVPIEVRMIVTTNFNNQP
jgi:TonB family protein